MKKVSLFILGILICQFGLCAECTITARSEAHQLERDGWVNIPGTPSLAEQLENCYYVACRCNGDGEPAYLFANSQSNIHKDFYLAYQDAIRRLIFTILATNHVSITALEEYFPPLGEKVTCSRMMIQNSKKQMVPYYEFVYAMHEDLEDTLFKGNFLDEELGYTLQDFPEIRKMLAMYRLSARGGVEIYLRYAMPNSDLVIDK